MRHVTKDQSGCWLWMGCKMRNGYGQMGFGGKHYSAHRFSYEEIKGAIPIGMELDHLCRVRNCVNPDHLEPVTRSENLKRAIGMGAYNARKQWCPHGHEYTRGNTRITLTNRRCCRTCERIRATKIRKEKSICA